MFMLFSILVLAVLVAACHGGQPRRCGLVLVGSLCLLFGGLRAGILPAPGSLTHLFSNVALADEKEVDQTAEPETDAGETAAGELEATPVQPEVTSTNEVDELAILEMEVASEGSKSGTIERVSNVTKLDEDRYPDWLKDPPTSSDFRLAGVAEDGDVQYVLVESTPGLTDSECQRDLDETLQEAANDYINDYLNSPRASLLLRYSTDDIRDRLVKETFEEGLFLEHYGTRMLKAYALLGFDHAFRQDLDQRWRQIVATVRLMQTGLGAAVVLTLLGALFGYFRFDTATRGYYTGRLQFATGAAILAIAALGVLVAQWIPWM